MSIINNKTPFDPNISSRKVNDSFNITSDRGWSPVYTIAKISGHAYFKLYNWIEGEGDMPFDPSLNTYYVGLTGFVTDINDAVDINAGGITDPQNLLDLLDTPTTYSGHAGHVTTVKSGTNGVEFINPQLLVNNTFIGLDDTGENNFIGHDNEVLFVNESQGLIEFINPQNLVNNTFIGLTDTPSGFSSLYKPKVNVAGNALEFIDDTFLNLNDVSPNSYTGHDGDVLVVFGNLIRFNNAQTLVNNTFIGLTDTPGSYPDSSALLPVPSTSYRYTVIENDSNDGIRFMDTPIKRNNNVQNSDVILNYDDDILKPQHFQFTDDTSDSWGAAEVGRMRMVVQSIGDFIYHKLQVWAFDNIASNNTYGWQDIHSGQYDTTT